jgi:tRNA modification GTPase
MPAASVIDLEDTIAAIATPPGPALRGIVRLSGRDAISIARHRFVSGADLAIRPRPSWHRGALRLPVLRSPLPAALAIWPGSRTYTGQPMTELHTTGARPILEAVLADCLTRGARLAGPGEYTLRAFLGGRIDLTQAEAVLGVIDAGSPAQLDAALRQLAGGLSGAIAGVRDELLDIVAHLEAELDFADEPDVAERAARSIAARLQRVFTSFSELVSRLHARDRPDSRPRVVLVGAPNAGKSSLFNALVGVDQAIVSHRPGTTRDYLSAHCTCDALAIELIDTAGVEDRHDSVLSRAHDLRNEVIEQADLLLICHAADSDEAEREIGAAAEVPRLHIATKCDLSGPSHQRWLRTSTRTGAGLDELQSAIARSLADPGESPATFATSARCHESLVLAANAVESALASLAAGQPDELAVLDLRVALDELGKVVGLTVTDDILDVIFSRFCIGK